jgi:CheY-like chemotaxis protein
MARILVIDDDPLACDFAVRSLRNRGNDVIGSTSSATALHDNNVDEIDLILTDIFMPEKDGLEVIMELRESHPNVMKSCVRWWMKYWHSNPLQRYGW